MSKKLYIGNIEPRSHRGEPNPPPFFPMSLDGKKGDDYTVMIQEAK